VENELNLPARIVFSEAFLPHLCQTIIDVNKMSKKIHCACSLIITTFVLVMPTPLDLLEETLGHFHEGARSVRAYTDDTTYIITKANDTGDFWVATEEPSFPKTKTRTLETYFEQVFGVEARY
jgi:hypothetical protein